MATFVLVHGGWAGGWQWREVASLLRAAGHEVFTPTLTGLGERVHLASPDVGLDTHIQDILMVLAYEELRDVILVGYSYSGMVITGVAERAPERLAHLVYLDAYVPRDGESLLDMLGPDAAAFIEQAAQAHGDGWRIPHDPPDAPRRTPHPLKTGQQPVSLTNPARGRLASDVHLLHPRQGRDGSRGSSHHPGRRARPIRWPVALSRVADGAQPVGDRAAGVGESSA